MENTAASARSDGSGIILGFISQGENCAAFHGKPLPALKAMEAVNSGNKP